MNLYPHRRPLLVPRHPRWSLVSSRPECSVTYFFSLCRTLLCDASPLQPDLNAADHTDHSGLLKTLHPLPPHSKYIAFPRGGFLQVAVSEAPTAEQLQSHDPWLGASDTALSPKH